jgi:hypothetical protein
MPSVTAGTIQAFRSDFDADGPIVQSDPATPARNAIAGSAPNGASTWDFSRTSAADFASITPTSFRATGHFTFAPVATVATTSATVKLTEGVPGGSTQTVTLGGAHTAPLESISAPGQKGLVGHALPEAPAAARMGDIASSRGRSGPAFAGSPGNSVFMQASATLSLRDGAPAPAASFGYNFSPVNTGAASVANEPSWENRLQGGTGMAPRPGGRGSPSDTPNAGIAVSGATYIPNRPAPARFGATAAGSVAGPQTSRFAGGSASTLGYDYSPVGRPAAPSLLRAAFNGDRAAEPDISQSVRSKPTGATGGPVFASRLVGSDAANTPTPVAHGAVGPATSVINFGTIQLNASNTVNLELQNLSSDLNGQHGSLTIEGYTITGADAASFSAASLSGGTAIPAGGTLVVPLTVVGTAVGELSSNLTIFTNEGAGVDGIGDSFTYFLDPMVEVSAAATSTPEPASLAVLGAGLAGLAGIRRRRRIA